MNASSIRRLTWFFGAAGLVVACGGRTDTTFTPTGGGGADASSSAEDGRADTCSEQPWSRQNSAVEINAERTNALPTTSKLRLMIGTVALGVTANRPSVEPLTTT